MFKKFICIIIVLLCIIPTIVYADKSNAVKQSIPDYYFTECPKHGNIEEVKVPSSNIQKTNYMMIWTPYNYNKNVKHEVILLLHGGGGSMHDMMDGMQRVNSNLISFANIYDWIAYENETRPFIVVTINNRTDRKIICDEIVIAFKYIINNYNTYAKDDSDEALIAARDHFTVGGLSNGSVTAYAFMGLKLEYAGNYICMSSYVDKSVDFNRTDYRLNYLIIGAGINENPHHDICRLAHKRLKQFANTAKFYEYVSAHDFTTWGNCVYDSIKLMYEKIPLTLKEQVFETVDIIATTCIENKNNFQVKLPYKIEEDLNGGF